MTDPSDLHPAEAPRLPRLASVQVLRAAAALTVVLHHAGYDADTLADRFGAVPLELGRRFDWSFGIHLFFAISGFIMVRAERGFGRPGAPWRFFGRRILRIVPLYWLMTTLVLIGSLVAPSLLNVPVSGLALLVGSYLFIPVTRPNGEIRPILGQGWTLDFEMAFYLLFGAAMLLPRRLGLATLAVAIMGLVVAGRWLSPDAPTLRVWTDAMLLEFLLGLGVGLMAETRLRLGAWSAGALGACGVLAAVLFGPSGLVPVNEVWIGQGLPAATILAACTLGPSWRETGPGLRARAVVGLGIIGDASYSLYLSHPFAIRVLRALWAATVGGRLPPAAFLLAAFAAAVAMGLLLHRFVERPMTRRLASAFPALRHRTPVVPTKLSGSLLPPAGEGSARR